MAVVLPLKKLAAFGLGGQIADGPASLSAGRLSRLPRILPLYRPLVKEKLRFLDLPQSSWPLAYIVMRIFNTKKGRL
jgi:hypothetical protein